MKAKIVLTAEKVDKEDLRSLIQLLREWELKTPQSTILGVLFTTEPELPTSEAEELFRGIFPEFKNVVKIPGPVKPDEGITLNITTEDPNLARLGQRILIADGELLGTVDELSLSIGRASPDELRKLQDAQVIKLTRITRG
jgi:hypothetical protein